MDRLTTETVHRTQVGRHLAIMISIGAAALVAGPDPALAHEPHGHPARIHEGSCEDLGPVAFRLNGVGGSVDLDNAPVATPTAVNPDAAYQVMVSETTIDGTIDHVLAADHAVMVYESDEAMDPIACGNVGGAMLDGALITALAENGVPGHVGFAAFTPDGEQTEVSVIVGHALAPVSAASGVYEPSDEVTEQAEHEHAEGEDADHEHDDDGDHQDEEDGHDAAATPEA